MKTLIILFVSVSFLFFSGCSDELTNNDPKPIEQPTDPEPDEPVTEVLNLDTVPESGLHIQRPVYKPIGGTIAAFYEALPANYESSEFVYPLLVFCAGAGGRGDGSPEQLPNMFFDISPPWLVREGKFPKDVVSEGKHLSFIILSLQTGKNQWTDPNDVNKVIDYALDNYRIDSTRIYVTGLSMGGGAVWEFASINPAHAGRVAAIVTMGALSTPTRERAQTVAEAHLHAWALHCDKDWLVPASNSINYVNWVNEVTPGLARLTLFDDTSHDAWSRSYISEYKENEMNIYEWMLQYRRIKTNK